MKLFVIAVLVILFDGCASSVKLVSPDDGELAYRESPARTPYDLAATGDSVHQGPTKQGERESVRKQVAIITAVVILAAIVWFFWMFGR
jgi:uncharacterized protein YceK